MILARAPRQLGETSTTPAAIATSPRTKGPNRCSELPEPLSALALEIPIRKNATTSRARPAGQDQRRTGRGAGGRPARAATSGSLAIALAGRAAAKYAATTASSIANPITSHGSWNAPIR